MPNGTYGGVRGTETKVGQKTFVSRPTRFYIAVIALHRRTLQNFRNDNILPYYKIGGKVIYDEAEIEEWLNSNYHPRY